MLLVVDSTEFAIRAEAAQSQKVSGLPMNPCESSSKNEFSDSVVGFESFELLGNWCDQSFRFLFTQVEVFGCLLDQSFKRSSFAVVIHLCFLANLPTRCTVPRFHQLVL